MMKKQIPVEYVLYPDEGHGFARPVFTPTRTLTLTLILTLTLTLTLTGGD